MAIITLVTQIFNLLYRRFSTCVASIVPDRLLNFVSSADYKSAIQQIKNLRYGIVVVSLLLVPHSTFAATHIVSMVNYRFDPANLSIAVGDTVTWRCDELFHDTVSGANGVANGLWNSSSQFPPIMRPGNMFSVTFNNPGNFPYFCTPHWRPPLNMVGSITVQSANAPPSVAIINPPNGANFDSPANINLEATAFDTDGDPVTVEFFMNGTSLGVVPAPPYQLAVNNLGPGNYTFAATARDTAGGINTASSSITVSGQQPTITTDPRPQTANVGEDVTFTVQATGSPPLSYEWLFEATVINGATGPSLVLTNVTLAQEGTYTVRVSNSFGSASASALLDVTNPPSGTPPTFDTHPQPQTVVAGTNVTFTAEASGSAPLSRQWFFKNAPIAGATSESLNLTNVTAANEGDYFMVASNAFGVAMSAHATLTVIVCDFTLSKSSASFPPQGGTDSVIVTAPPGCDWKIVNTNFWILPDVGPGVVTITAVSNATRTARSGVLIIAGNVFTVSQAAVQFPAKNDFNHDGQTDFLFQNTDGRVNVWLMDGTTRIGVARLRNGRPAAPGSRIVGTHDFDLDRNVDILWQRSDGILQIWFMSATNFLRSELISPAPALGKVWQAVGMGDFNRDLHADILLRHTEGYLLLWYMRGKQFVRQSLVHNGQAIPNLWRVVGTADLNNDGTPDIVWQKPSSAIVVWFMSKENPLQGPLLSNLPRMDAAIVGMNDLNQDGSSDFIWRHSDNHLSTWWMKGTNRIGSFPIIGGETVPPAWKFTAPRN